MGQKSAGNIVGPFLLLIVLLLGAGIVKGCNAVVQFFSEGSMEEQAQIVLDFEQRIISIEQSVTDIGDQISGELSSFEKGTIPNLAVIENAEEEFRKVSTRIEAIEIPSGLTEERENKLEEMKQDFSDSYAFKSYAMRHFRLYLQTYTEEELAEFMNMSSLAQDNLTGAVTEMVLLKKELGVSEF